MRFAIFDRNGHIDCDPEPMVFDTRKEAVEVLNSDAYDSADGYTVGEVVDRVFLIEGDGSGNTEIDKLYPDVESAIKDAEYSWRLLTPQEKKAGAYVWVAIVNEDYENGSIRDIVWENGEAVE